MSMLQMTPQLSFWLAALCCGCVLGRACFVIRAQRDVAAAIYLFLLNYCKPSEFSMEEWSGMVALVTGTDTTPELLATPENFFSEVLQFPRCCFNEGFWNLECCLESTSTTFTPFAPLDHSRTLYQSS